MTIEQITSGAASTIADLDPTLPDASDNKSEGDDHIRNTKKALQLTFPEISATVSSNASELNFPHKGGTVSGAAYIKGRIDCSLISASATSVLPALYTEQLRTQTITATASAGFFLNANFHATASISHLIAGNIRLGVFQASATAEYKRGELTASYLSSGNYKVSHDFNTMGYVAQIQPGGMAATAFRNAHLYSVGSSEFLFELRTSEGTLANGRFQIFLMKL